MIQFENLGINIGKCYNIVIMTLRSFIKNRKYLLWWVQDVAGADEQAIVEATLNYGDWPDVQELIKILGIKKTAAIFRRQIRGRRQNYSDKAKHFFTLYFNRYA